MKVGRSQAEGDVDGPERDARRVRDLLVGNPELKVRLDANAAWTLEEALRFADALPEKFIPRIEYIEEPVRSHVDWGRFRAFGGGIPLACDESMEVLMLSEKEEQGVEVIHKNCAAAILRPAMTGYRKTLEWAKDLVSCCSEQSTRHEDCSEEQASINGKTLDSRHRESRAKSHEQHRGHGV